jgi:cyclophilin family peptidyl-prolyl cis-trans isomerase
MLGKDVPVVATAAMNALAGRDGTDVKALGQVTAAEAEDVIVRAAAVGLIPPDDPELVWRLAEIWEAARDDPQNDVRMAVSRALASLPGKEATDLAGKLLREDADWRVRVEAAAALAARGVDPVPEVGPLDTGRDAEDYEALLRDSAAAPRVVLTLDAGRIVLELFGREAPLTVESFLSLAEEGYFDGLTFHRVVPNFVVQGGDPRGDGWGGPGYQIRCEINRRPYRRGTVGMALDGKDTGGSQFFITHTPQPHLDGNYTVFGRVVEGMEVVDHAVQGDRIVSVTVER